jgi:exonuclease VII large subunit
MNRSSSPQRILEKGFAIIYQDDKIVSSSDKVEMGKNIRVRMAEHSITAKTISKKENDGNESDI